jgi:hypothetical protein
VEVHRVEVLAEVHQDLHRVEVLAELLLLGLGI